MRPAVNSRSRLYQINRSQRWPGYTATVYVIKFGQGTYVSGTTMQRPSTKAQLFSELKSFI